MIDNRRDHWIRIAAAMMALAFLLAFVYLLVMDDSGLNISVIY